MAHANVNGEERLSHVLSASLRERELKGSQETFRNLAAPERFHE